MMNKYRYLIKALRLYRKISYGQFDKEYSDEVQETQDAADAIEELLEENEKLIKENKELRYKIADLGEGAGETGLL